MTIKSSLHLLLKLLLLLLSLLFTFIISNTLINPLPDAATPSPEEAGQALVALLGIGLLNALSWYFPLEKARWRGLLLVGAIFLLQFGITSLMPQLDTLFFEAAFTMPEGTVNRILSAGLLQAALFAPLAVSIFQKWKGRNIPSGERYLFGFSTSQWVVRVLGLTTLYVLFYFLFGYFIAWQSPVLREFYSGSTELKTFAAHFGELFAENSSLIIFQFFRGLLWVALSVLFIKMVKGKRLTVALALALLFGVLHTSQLLLPNPLMPAPVRWMHFWEVLTSMALFGFISGWTLLKGKTEMEAPGFSLKEDNL